ncbi:MAG: radical SAM family heme chaperone HemW [Clostridia bacterium]|nr:radical SAM family heme chaperone HemW [Clostridia bacterium]
MEKIGLYVHIPFCHSKCAYCDFSSYAIGNAQNKIAIIRYVKALLKEIDLYEQTLKSVEVETLFIGGGTPTCIDGKYIHEIINHLRKSTKFSENAEVTIESNPGTITTEKLDHYLSAGINRFSVGLQTTDNNLLSSIGRIHDFNTFTTSFNAIRESGIKNINVDIMFGLPGQTSENLHHTLDTLIELSPEHISAYALKLEEGTPMYEAERKGLIQMPDEELERTMYHEIINKLKINGYYQYEISNFSKKGFESRHNLVYWKNKPYLGLGLAAHSKMEQIRFSNEIIMSRYLERIENGEKPSLDQTVISDSEDLFETVILGLRLNEGLNIPQLNERYGMDFLSENEAVISKLTAQGLIQITGDILKLTLKGIDLSNQVFLAFMND